MDTILCALSVVIAELLSPKLPEKNFGELFPTVGMGAAMAIALHMMGTQRTSAGFRASEVLTKTLAGTVVGAVGFAMVEGLVRFELVGRYVILLSTVYSTMFVTGSRLVLWRLAERTKRRILVYGSAVSFEEIRRVANENRLPVEFVLPKVSVLARDGGTGGDAVIDLCRAEQVSEIVVERPEELQRAEREALLLCTGAGMSVADLAGFYERHLQRVYVNGLRDAWFWSYDPAHIHPIYFGVKRAIDVAVSIVGLVLTSPLYPILLLFMRIQDGGPLMYSQVRTGRLNKPFTILKFRTMRTDAEQRGPKWASKKDSRVTFIGRLLRKTRIDEVPQFWNILKGDMSFVGPRPERPEFVAKLDEDINYYRYRHLITPGLTGWAQINYPYGASVADAREKLSYDLYYLKYASITLDILIILRTLGAMARGAR